MFLYQHMKHVKHTRERQRDRETQAINTSSLVRELVVTHAVMDVTNLVATETTIQQN